MIMIIRWKCEQQSDEQRKHLFEGGYKHSCNPGLRTELVKLKSNTTIINIGWTENEKDSESIV